MPKVGLLWRAEWDPASGPGAPVAESCKLNGVFAAFDALGVRAEPVVYADDESTPFARSCSTWTACSSG